MKPKYIQWTVNGIKHKMIPYEEWVPPSAPGPGFILYDLSREQLIEFIETASIMNLFRQDGVFQQMTIDTNRDGEMEVALTDPFIKHVKQTTSGFELVVSSV